MRERNLLENTEHRRSPSNHVRIILSNSCYLSLISFETLKARNKGHCIINLPPVKDQAVSHKKHMLFIALGNGV